ncbi:hypothetical protein [Aquisphaera insulae]|uniref:hypothetical protein n=1 Tax=Aquisphaera insulae TaxID=2712864 RepID=UPI00196A9A9F|nr:hypothetical protein [Aquisphaera insulae]
MIEPVPTAVIDACVLYSAPVRDLIVRLAQAGTIHARWTAEIHDDLTLPDPNDRHVLAAAIRAGASRILTFNLADFPSGVLDAYGVKALHPDPFLAQLLDAVPDEFLEAIRLQREALKNPPMTEEEFLARLETAGLPRTVARLRLHGQKPIGSS